MVVSEQLKENCALIVNSCDAYCDIWEVFFTCLSNQWPDCQLDIILNTESKVYEFDGLNLNVKNINSNNPNKAWGARLLNSLQSVEKEFVITLFDDFLIENEVKVDNIISCIEWMKSDELISVFYFYNNQGKNIDDGRYSDFELTGKYNDYRLNSSPAIWRRKRLIELTSEIDNPWAWECFGSVRTYNEKYKMYCAKIGCEETFSYKHQLGGGIRRGKWVRSVVDPLIEQYGLELDLTKRGIASESLKEGKYSLKWKINFFILGFRMVGLRSLIFWFRALNKKLFK